MNVVSRLKLSFLFSVLALLVLPTQLVQAADNDDGQRAPPEARTAGTLSEPIMRAINEIQGMLSPEDDSDEPDLEGAKEALDRLRERRFARMNDFEKSTMLNFYTNYYLTIEDYQGALRTFEEILTIETLREDTRLRTLRSLGQLYAAEEEWQNSINNYQAWRELSPEEDDVVYRGLSYAHYQLQEFEQALPYWISYMEILLAEGEELGRDDYAYLNGIYFTLEDFASALELTKSMIMLFDNPIDWMNLSAVYASLDNEPRRVQSLNVAYLKGYLEDENRFLNLGQSMAGQDMPYSGSKILKDGFEKGVIEESEDNLTTFAQMYLIGSDYELALEPAQRVAEMSDSGDAYDTLGYIYYVLHNYESAVDAFQAAVDKGNLSNASDTYLFLSRSLIELDDFDGALAAARQAADAGDSSEREQATNYISFIDSTKSRYDVLATRRADAIDFYESYPSLID